MRMRCFDSAHHDASDEVIRPWDHTQATDVESTPAPRVYDQHNTPRDQEQLISQSEQTVPKMNLANDHRLHYGRQCAFYFIRGIR